MGQINTTNLPQYVSDARPAAPTPKLTADPSATAAQPSQDTQTPQDALQLTKLSSAINNLKKSATTMRSQAAQVMSSVRSGNYQVDSMQVSRSIVGESLSSH